MNKQKGSVLVIALSVIILISLATIGIVAFLNYHPNEVIQSPKISDTTGEVTTTKQASTTVENSVGRIHIEAPVTTTVNCDEEGCFDKKFKNCERATMSASIPGLKTTYYAEIIGPEKGRCKVLTKYTQNPNPDWVNKTMTCLYDNSIGDFQTVSQQALRDINSSSLACQGELFKIFSSLNFENF